MSKKEFIPTGTVLRLSHGPSAPSEMPPPVALTARERDLVRLLGRGMTDRQMGAELCISEWTVKTHVQNLREKFCVHTRAAVVALSWGLLRDGPADRE